MRVGVGVVGYAAVMPQMTPGSQPPLLVALHKFHLGEVDREATVAVVAKVLDFITPFELIPGVGGLIEAATDLIWLPAAEAIVSGFEKAKAGK